MTNLYYGYDLRNYATKSGVDINSILKKHIERFGNPPSILINKSDSESIPKEFSAKISKLPLPYSIFLEILEVENET